MIIETVVTTVDAHGSVNVAPMGAIVSGDAGFAAADVGFEFCLKPFETSHTWQNLQQTREGVLHLTDNSLWFVQGALDCWQTTPATRSAGQVGAPVLADACAAFEFQVERITTQNQRAEVTCRVVQRHTLKPFAGVNRSLFAAIEMAILATRFHLASPAAVAEHWERCRLIIEKTGGQDDHRALAILDAYRDRWLHENSQRECGTQSSSSAQR